MQKLCIYSLWINWYDYWGLKISILSSLNIYIKTTISPQKNMHVLIIYVSSGFPYFSMSVFQALFNPLQQIFDKLTFHLILTITMNKTKTEFVQIWWELKALFVTFTAYYIEKKDKTIHYRLRLPLLSLARNDFIVSSSSCIWLSCSEMCYI